MLNHIITVVWVVGIMNSINMLDNMDAVSTLVAISILGYAFIYQFIKTDTPGIFMFILVGIISCLCSFLYFNWYPSKMFMGDTGSQLLGVFLAAAGIHSCFESTMIADENNPFIQILVTCLVFCIPFIDTATVIVNRMLRGKSPFVGGRDHTTHSLFFKGITERRIALLFTFLSLLGAGMALYLVAVESISYILTAFFAAYFLILLFTLFFLNRITIR